MKVLAVLIVGGPLMAMSGLPAAASHLAPVPVNERLLQVADNDDFATRKDAYLQKTRNEMTEWRKKMDAAGEGAEAEGHEASADMKEHLKRTWSATERGWRKLETESAEGWDNTKTAYERSTAELRVQWHKIHPEDKD
jgi:hypothetical protein